MGVERWRGTEREVCKALGKRHLGAPGEPDCSSSGEVVEVKAQGRRVNQWQMKEILGKPWSAGRPLIVASTSGFTAGARQLAGEFERVHLYKVYGGGRNRSSRRTNPPR